MSAGFPAGTPTGKMVKPVVKSYNKRWHSVPGRGIVGGSIPCKIAVWVRFLKTNCKTKYKCKQACTNIFQMVKMAPKHCKHQTIHGKYSQELACKDCYLFKKKQGLPTPHGVRRVIGGIKIATAKR